MSRSLETFKAEFLRLAELYGLRDWNIEFTSENLGDSNAQMHYNAAHNRADVELNRNLHNVNAILRAARHEAFHLFTARLEALAMSRYVTRQEIGETTERMARVMEKLNVEEVPA